MSSVYNSVDSWKVISCFYGVAISAWLLKFSDFQRNFCFGSKLGDRAGDFKKKADFLSVLSFMFCGL